jgi:pyrimidine-nucleoside phosphorylase
MRMYDIIMKKRDGDALSKEEIEFAIKGYTDGSIPDYQMSALLMAIYFQSMNDEETTIMTESMAHSGDMVDLSAIKGIKVDKHSTGGVGDKTTLIVAPIVAACGVKVAKMTGRGLGHTGGTADKLESIEGFKISLEREKFFEIVNDIGLSVIGQSGNLTPADKKLYALRDVTATVDSIPLIAASIMSKKLAAGSDCIVLDVKVGSGAFMKSIDDSIKLATTMVNIGEKAGRRTAALITNMDVPLGHAVGNSLEVIEAVDTLKGHGPQDLTDVCVKLAANMLNLAGKGDIKACTKMAEDAIKDGSAFEKLNQMVKAQGGNAEMLNDTSRFKKSDIVYEIKADSCGYISFMNTEKCGIVSVILGAGRETKDSQIDSSAGIIIKSKTGDYVKAGDVLATLHTSKQELVESAESLYKNALQISEEKPDPEPLVYALVNKDGVKYYN